MTPKVIGLCGVARCGKDSFANFLKESKQNYFCKSSFAFELKKDLDSFLTDKLGISAFTEDNVEKEIIRPLLICWGTDVIREKVNKNQWIDKIEKKVLENYNKGLITIIPDVRFSNEVEWIKQNGFSIYIHQEGCLPNGYIEQETIALKTQTDYYFEWPKIENFAQEGPKMVKEFFYNTQHGRSMQ